MKWFVYSNETYYPQAYVLEAKTADEAYAKVVPSHTNGHHGVAVFPVRRLPHLAGRQRGAD